MFGAVLAAIAWFQEHWEEIEDVAQRLALDLAALWALGMALAQVLKPFFPGAGEALEGTLFAFSR